MTERTIQQSLRRWADNHRYILVNAYVFDWESDFFSITKSHNSNEVEIKISKADFRKDFEKDKHKFFDALLKKKSHVVTKSQYRLREAGDLLGRICYKELQIGWSMRRGATGKVVDPDIKFTDDEDSFGYWHLRDRNIYLQERHSGQDIHARATKIEIEEIAQKRLPHKFYYACPAGLLQVDDMPAYAGLLWVYESKVLIKKKAPALHTRLIGDNKMYEVLADKFWWLSHNMRSLLTRHNIPYKDCIEDKPKENTI